MKNRNASPGNTKGPNNPKGMVMKKMLITLATVGVLAVPAGVAFAQTDTTEPAAPVPTCVDPVRDRDRDRSADRIALGEQAKLQTQLRTHQHEQMALNDGTCDADCTADQARLRDQSSLADGTGFTAEHRMGEMGKAASNRGNG